MTANKPLRGVVIVLEDDGGVRNEGRINTACELADAAVRRGGASVAVPTLGRHQGRWRGLPARTTEAFRAMLRVRRAAQRAETLVYVSGSSLTSGSALRGLLYRILSGSADLVLVATQRTGRPGLLARRALRRAHARVVTFDSRHARSLRSVDVVARSVVPGVSRETFGRRSAAERAECAEALGLERGGACVLHVGHLTRQRRLSVLADLARRSSATVLVVAGSACAADEAVVSELRGAGVVVLREDVADMRPIYCGADVYVFPTRDVGGAIGFPLSVLEALAVGVPVVSTPFNDLPATFPDGSGIFYADSSEEFCDRVHEVLSMRPSPVIDESCLRSWDAVLEEILDE